MSREGFVNEVASTSISSLTQILLVLSDCGRSWYDLGLQALSTIAAQRAKKKGKQLL